MAGIQVKKEDEVEEVYIKCEPEDYVISGENVGQKRKHDRDAIDSEVEFVGEIVLPQSFHLSSATKNMDMSIFCSLGSIFDQLRKLSGKVYLTNFEFGKHFLSTLFKEPTQFKILRTWKVYYIEENDDVKVLLAKMGVKNGLPVMRHQIIINSYLQVSLFYGPHALKSISLSSTQVQSEKCIKSLVREFSQWKPCIGLPQKFPQHKWPTLIKHDLAGECCRHYKCEIVHQTKNDYCDPCRYLITREKKRASRLSNTHMTIAMIMNYKYWKNMKKGVKQLKVKNKRLVQSRKRLKQRLIEMQNQKTVLSEDETSLDVIVKLEDDNVKF